MTEESPGFRAAHLRGPGARDPGVAVHCAGGFWRVSGGWNQLNMGKIWENLGKIWGTSGEHMENMVSDPFFTGQNMGTPAIWLGRFLGIPVKSPVFNREITILLGRWWWAISIGRSPISLGKLMNCQEWCATKRVGTSWTCCMEDHNLGTDVSPQPFGQEGCRFMHFVGSQRAKDRDWSDGCRFGSWECRSSQGTYVFQPLFQIHYNDGWLSRNAQKSTVQMGRLVSPSLVGPRDSPQGGCSVYPRWAILNSWQWDVHSL